MARLLTGPLLAAVFFTALLTAQSIPTHPEHCSVARQPDIAFGESSVPLNGLWKFQSTLPALFFGAATASSGIAERAAAPPITPATPFSNDRLLIRSSSLLPEPHFHISIYRHANISLPNPRTVIVPAPRSSSF